MTEFAPVVSSDDEPLILVNEADEPRGTMPKLDCHLGDGQLHRAFSVFIFNRNGDVLLQKRSRQKFLWPGYWSNACCSHPREGEDSLEAATRRIHQELGINVDLTYLYKFEYQARFANVGTEHELCWVWVGFAEADEITANTNEIEDWRFFTRDELNRELNDNPDAYTPWMKMEWERIFSEHRDVLGST